MIYYIFFFVQSILDLLPETQETVRAKYIFKIIVSTISGISVLISLIHTILGLKVFFKYTIQQTLLKINEDLAKFLIRNGLAKGCDFYDDFVIKREYFYQKELFKDLELNKNNISIITTIDVHHAYNIFENNKIFKDENDKTIIKSDHFIIKNPEEKYELVGSYWFKQNHGYFAFYIKKMGEKNYKKCDVKQLHILNLKNVKLNEFIDFIKSKKYKITSERNFVIEGTVHVLDLAEKLKFLSYVSGTILNENNCFIFKNLNFLNSFNDSLTALPFLAKITPEFDIDGNIINFPNITFNSNYYWVE
jgi:hypothetical protein